MFRLKNVFLHYKILKDMLVSVLRIMMFVVIVVLVLFGVAGLLYGLIRLLSSFGKPETRWKRFAAMMVPLIDPWLKPYKQNLLRRHQMAVLRTLDLTDGKCPLKDKANHHLYYGLHKSEKNTWIFREKAPNAKQIFLIGDFSYWQVEGMLFVVNL